MLAQRVSLLVATLAIAACGGSRNDSPPRSPSLDYPLPAAQTSDGEIVGADRIPPGDKLEQGPRVGTAGASPSAGPGSGGHAGSQNKPQPCAEIGLEDSSGKTRCKKAPDSAKPAPANTKP